LLRRNKPRGKVVRMNQPLTIDLPHKLGAEEAKRRMQDGIGHLKDHIPGGAAEVRSSWQGDRMNLAVQAMGQEVSAHIDVEETVVRVEMLLPPMLSFFGKQIEGYLRNKGGQMLEDKSKKV
jgi:hypothetical protein